jgi:pyruvate/2-oxoglutarate dehydrogenase complex dihydrolipoamide dehydrogenase (E3) component
MGSAKLASASQVDAIDAHGALQSLKAKNIVIATGASSFTLAWNQDGSR